MDVHTGIQIQSLVRECLDILKEYSLDIQEDTITFFFNKNRHGFSSLEFLLNIYLYIFMYIFIKLSLVYLQHSEGLQSPAEDCGQCSFSVDLSGGGQSFMCGATGWAGLAHLNPI